MKECNYLGREFAHCFTQELELAADLASVRREFNMYFGNLFCIDPEIAELQELRHHAPALSGLGLQPGLPSSPHP
jgi:hypothetical protein